jgi:hypothetical protein
MAGKIIHKSPMKSRQVGSPHNLRKTFMITYSQRSLVDVASNKEHHLFQCKLCIGEDHFGEVNSWNDESSERSAFGLA